MSCPRHTWAESEDRVGDLFCAMVTCWNAAVIAGMWPDPADNEANTKWVQDYYADIHSHSGTDGGYSNFMADDDRHRVSIT